MKPGLAKGTRDFSSAEVYRRRHIMNVLQKNFELFGFQPLETPSFENLSTLTGKYGEEGDRLIFKILNSGNFLEKISDEELGLKNFKNITPQITDKALRYDLTVPFARYIAMNHGQLSFPFKRYQIQPVWRADRPQKGRFREFWQCDADVVGSESLLLEVDLISLYQKSFVDLGVNVRIHINNRKILTAIAEYAGIENQLIDFTVALDKLDKIGKEAVLQELTSKNISAAAIAKLEFLFTPLSEDQLIRTLREKLLDKTCGIDGIDEIEFVLNATKNLGIYNVVFDLTLARGIDYYTGAIFEVKAVDADMGSIGGGGRYNNLTEVFGVKNIPGIGISFGLDRIYLVMEERGLFPETLSARTEFLFANYGGQEASVALQIIAHIRAAGHSAELYPEMGKMKKFFAYADKKLPENLVFIGEQEIADGTVTIKNQTTGEQKSLTVAEFYETL